MSKVKRDPSLSWKLISTARSWYTLSEEDAIAVIDVVRDRVSKRAGATHARFVSSLSREAADATL